MKSLIEIRKQQRSKSDPSKVLGEFEIEGNNIRQVIELSENYRSSGGYRLLGLVHLHTPKIPFLFDWVLREDSKELLIKAVRRSPEHLGNLFALAKIYDKLGDKEKCDRLLNTIINTPPRKFMLNAWDQLD